MSLVKDAPETLQILSLFLQIRDVTGVSADFEVDIALRTLRSMRQADGVNTKCMNDEFDHFHMFKAVKVSQLSDRDNLKAEVLGERFFVSLADNIERRLDDVIISAAAALTHILFGDDKLLTIHKTLAVEATSSPKRLMEFHQFKCHGVIRENLHKSTVYFSKWSRGCLIP
ncbi:hypothetical protein M9458_053960 [Cirrhinus mrigala]|uniref:Uncharacterized protein n=1 Tax=Cirrhinus mrigala TaxID=683832 RepID=A0ABD0MKY1_CIRMR